MFTNLHTHTEYSLLDGLSRIPQLLDRAKALGQQAMAITDHGAMYGVITFAKEAQKREMKPIIGVEAYVAPGSRFAKDAREKTAYYHLTLLARNQEGYSNLARLTTKANLEGYYYKPRMDKEILSQYGKGIIALSGCPSGEVFKALLDERYQDAKEALDFYKQAFDGLFIEIQDHPDANGELRQMLDAANPRLIKLAREMNLPLVATNDSHYTLPEDAHTHEVLLCIGTNATMDDPKRFRLEGDTYFVKSEQEMLAMFPEIPEAVTNTQQVAEACDLQFEWGRISMPQPAIPDGMTPFQFLMRSTFEGLQRRYGMDAAGVWPVTPSAEPPKPGDADEVRRRLEYELHVVEVTGFAEYILIVAEIAQAARERGIPMGVRGSAAASILLYTLGVTDIDPVANRLVFERFLNVERREMPDVDMDFADDRREEMITWAGERYGRDRVAQIITFGTMGAKAAIRDTGRALAWSFSDTDRVARLIPTALHMTIDRALEENIEFKQLYEADDRVRELVDTAKKLEGVTRHAGTHAAGVVIARDPLIDHVPLQRPARGDENALPVIQYEMGDVAEIGLLKMDFLGLSNLTILGRAVDLIKKRHNVALNLVELPDGDPATYDLLGRGETFAVFQLESAGMRRYIQELKPSTISELSAMVALYRPGPMAQIPRFIASKHGREPITYPHDSLAQILDETYGVIVYQDQVLFILREFAGYTMGEADKVRKAMGKKIAEMMKAEREKFVKGGKKQGFTPDDAEAVFDLIEPFAGYAFNKSHSVCYGTIAYQTAYLKANYPAEYMTAVLALADSHPAGFAERVGAAVAECVKLGISVLGPDVNRSELSFSIEDAATAEGGTVTGSAIRFGLATVKNVGEGAVEGIVKARLEGGPFTSLQDFCRRAELRNFNKRTLESLVKAGALDNVPNDAEGARTPDTATYRTTLIANLDRITRMISREQELKDSGQTTMFDLFGAEVQTPMAALELEEVAGAKGEVLAWEKEMLGVYVSDHPFKRAHPAMAAKITAVLSELTMEMAGRDLVVAGMIASARTQLTKAGKTFVRAQIEDLTGTVEVIAWPDLYERTREYWQPGKILLLSVRLRQRDDRLDITIDDAAMWEEASGKMIGSSALLNGTSTAALNGGGATLVQQGPARPAAPQGRQIALDGVPAPPHRGAAGARGDESWQDVMVAGDDAPPWEDGGSYSASDEEWAALGEWEMKAAPATGGGFPSLGGPQKENGIGAAGTPGRPAPAMNGSGPTNGTNGAHPTGAAGARPNGTNGATTNGTNGAHRNGTGVNGAHNGGAHGGPDSGREEAADPAAVNGAAGHGHDRMNEGRPAAGSGSGGAPANGNGHGAGEKKRNPYARPEPIPVPTEDRSRRLLRITIRETADQAEDRRRLADLVRALRQLPGPDEVRLKLVTPFDEYEVAAGTTLATDGIHQRLGDIIQGWGEVSVEPFRR